MCFSKGVDVIFMHDNVEGRQLHWHSQHHTDSSNLQGAHVEFQRVLSTHSVNDAIQAPTDCLSSTKGNNR